MMDDIKLPPLEELPGWSGMDHRICARLAAWAKAYARQAVLMDREQCAAAIRAQSLRDLSRLSEEMGEVK